MQSSRPNEVVEQMRQLDENPPTITGGSDNDRESRRRGSCNSSNLASQSSHKDEEYRDMITKEDTALLRLKCILVLVLVGATIVVAVAVFRRLSIAEHKEFQTTFHADAVKVFEAMGSKLDLSLGDMDSYIVALVSYARTSNSTWPFVTIPDHAVRAAKVRDLSNAIVLEQYHIVNDENRAQWEEYSIINQSWVREAIEVQADDEAFEGRKDIIEFPICKDLFNSDGIVPANTGPYAPLWQNYPVVPLTSPFNFDALHGISLRNGFSEVEQHHKVVISEVINLKDPADAGSDYTVEAVNSWASSFLGPGVHHTEPMVRFLYPVLDTAANSVTLKDTASSNMVAVLGMTLYWRGFLQDVLPVGDLGLVVVVENACSQSITYQVNGPDVKYLGPGDLHDPQFEDQEMSSTVKGLRDYFRNKRLYSGLPLSGDYCEYTFRAYPSKAMENQFKSSDPVVFSIIVVAIFLIPSLVFLLYDKLVANRQNKVMKAAVRDHAIVSSLFPKTVLDRFFQAEEKKRMSLFEPTNLKIKSLKIKSFQQIGDNGDTSMKQSNHDGTIVPIESRPIADLFPETTIMFADIAGFTAWSSVREPAQVFTLLETIYSAFDKIANRRAVFKVETIGDSYVAVVGLPEPRKDHAVVMVKFATDCRSRFQELTSDLKVTLGPETGDLRLRLGLHSGPVTAGVLRGQKSRFQLFGDTVNTASRMESTGVPNRVQVSQTTADLLVRADKGHWLQLRDKKVEVKGKGLMQTYWAEPKAFSPLPTTNVDT